MKSWDPFRDLVSIQDRMNKLFEALLTGPVPLDEQTALGQWQPPVEVIELPDRIEIRCDLAGMRRDQIDLNWDGTALTLSGERQRPDLAGDWTWHRVERSWGRFRRRFELPEGFAGDRATDRLESGVLTVVVPRDAGAVRLEAEASVSVDH
ncbi:MAG: Hsp20/alpha crystallin family protein [Acidobacteria bacterium]|nr:MAG: Hsp20/alpha crystallin family protein [Acidobacteriota bacterium]